MSKKRTIEITLAGYTFSLKNLKVHDDMSEETVCFSADLVCNGKVIAHCSNDGHGGCTDVSCCRNDPNYDLYCESIKAIQNIRDTEYEKEMNEFIAKHNHGTVVEPWIQYWNDCHLADRLMEKQSAWDDAVKKLKKFAKKNPCMQIWFNGEVMCACTATTFASTDGTKYENVTDWVR